MAYSSYAKQTWADAPATSSPISAARLGTIENGIAGVDANLSGLFVPSDYGWISWNYDPYYAYTSSLLGTAGVVLLSQIPIRQPCTITNVLTFVATAGATLTSGQCFASLFKSDGTLLSATADQSTAWASTGLKTMALASAQTITTPGLYYVGFFWNGTTSPKFSYNAATISGQGANSGPFPRSAYDSIHAARTTTFPNPATITAFANSAFWVAAS